MWEYLKAANICAERQLLYRALDRNLYLDFALFCRSRNINIECDGNEHHLKKEDVLYDKKRNNFLESHGWSVLRFSTVDIYNNESEMIDRVKETINQCGGLELLKDYKYKFFETENNPLLFFDSSDNSV
jgi:very-short-patch-repair endonuclease